MAARRRREQASAPAARETPPWPADAVERRPVASRRTKIRVCVDCGDEKEIRNDSQAVRCITCTARIGGFAAAAKPRSPSLKIACENCGKTVSTIMSAPRKFCSMECRRIAQSVERKCKMCGVVFRRARNVISGKSNSSGNFCNRSCYERFLCRTDRVSGRGSQWKKSRDEALRRHPYCALCGTMKNLEVHHAIPFRLTRDNSQENLFPLCKKHHKHVETIFLEVEEVQPDMEQALLAWRVMLGEWQWATRAKLLEIRRGLTN